MHKNVSKPSVRCIAGHMATGSVLGAFGSLSVLLANPDVFRMITNSSAPALLVLTLVLGSAAVIAVGSGITGFVLHSVESGSA